ncbi:uncharacterized protein LOC116342918 [Contarinia nasturtii]|uniref:uncharacterized protein LOC116342918 n=1 Tax=Contarinia nasturtii TaxID=265458 RepID=UPI0012D412A6|nr:uncharacterized protein LOC116342918 [Contarinia nasturtii]
MAELRKKHKTWIKEFLTPNLVENQKLITCKNPKEHIEIEAIEIKEMSLEVAFMLTVCYFVKISIKIRTEHEQCEGEDGYDETLFDIVVKFAPDVEPDLYEIWGMQEKFGNEITTYEHIAPKIESLSKSPKCLYSHNEPSDAVIVLSDFSNDGWKMSKLKVNLPLDHIIVAVKELGRFHGQMYALKLTDADAFQSMKSRLLNSRFGEVTDEWNICLELGIRRATYSVRTSIESREIVPETFLKRLEEVMYGVYDYLGKRNRPIEPIAIICHGDYLRNNIAFRYDVDGKAIEAMMFDFQTMCYSSPMIDLTTFIANSTGWKVRNKHFSEIFSAYHESLIGSFIQASKWEESKIPEYLKYDNMLKEYACYLPFGLGIASAFLQFLHDKETPNFEQKSPIKETIRFALDKGGDVVDAELRALVVDIYQLHDKLDLNLEKL